MKLTRARNEIELARAQVTLECAKSGATSVTVEPPDYLLDAPIRRGIERVRELMALGEWDEALRECQGIGRVKQTVWHARSWLSAAHSRSAPEIASVFEEMRASDPRVRHSVP